MSEHWIHKLHELSLEQLEELIKEIGECAPLTKEYRIKLLMEKLPELRRELAKTLVTTDRSTLGANIDESADQLAIIFSRQKLIPSEITDLRVHCSDEGKKTLDRAFRRFTRDPMFQGRADLAETALLKGLQDQIEAEENGTKYSDDEVVKDIESTADAYDEMMRLREWLRDEYDIHEKADYYMMMDAMRVIYETYKEQWKRSSRAELNALTRRARALYETARTYRCTPTRLQQWRELKRQPLSPNGIYTRPDGVRIWGTGELVIETKDGPKRPIQTIFGKVMPEGSVPFEFEMEKMLNRAFPEEKPQGT